MSMNKQRRIMAAIAALVLVLSGCGQAIYKHDELGSERFKNFVFANPQDSEETYLAIEFKGRTYVPYGTIQGSISEQDIKECVGCIVQDETNSSVPDPENTDFRVYSLADDPDCNFLMDKYIGSSVMEQPYFYRALDSMGQNINIPSFIFDLDYEIWNGQIVKVYEVTNEKKVEEYQTEDKLVTVVRYYEMDDKTWRTDQQLYKYRLEITGRMSGAAKDSTFVYLSNLEEISFDQAWKAAGFSSNTADYFDVKDAILVACK